MVMSPETAALVWSIVGLFALALSVVVITVTVKSREKGAFSIFVSVVLLGASGLSFWFAYLATQIKK